MRITCSQADFRHCNVEKRTVERGQDQGKTTIRAEGWSVELESVHARQLVVELPDVETEARGEAPTARGWPGDSASVADAGVANLSPVGSGGLERPEQAAVIPPRDHRSCGSGELPESPTKGGPSCLN